MSQYETVIIGFPIWWYTAPTISKFHLQNAKEHGVTQKEIAAVITHVAFYTGWPKGWAVFQMAKEVWELNEGDLPYEDEAIRAHAKEMVFPIGEPNDAYAQYFVGRSYLVPISTSQMGIFKDTFEINYAIYDRYHIIPVFFEEAYQGAWHLFHLHFHQQLPGRNTNTCI